MKATFRPLVSVIMTCYNRQFYVSSAIESILNQTYDHFEFIIIDDCSQDESYEIIKKYAEIDPRIVALRNKKNSGLIYSLNKGLELARGEFIARMDDDDISLPQRFEKQIEYMLEHPETAVLGTYLKSFDIDGKEHKSWVDADKAGIVKVLLNFKCPVSHPCVMIRASFLKEQGLRYDEKYKHAEDYGLWCEIVLRGGLVENLPEILFEHRVTHNSISRNPKTNKAQREVAESIRRKMLGRFFQDEELEKILKQIKLYPFLANKAKILYQVVCKMRQKDVSNQISSQDYDDFIKHFCGVKDTMHIFFAVDDNYVQHLSVALASILVNSSELDNFHFYVLSDFISDENKKNIEKLREIKGFKIEYLEVENDTFDKFILASGLEHITKQTYYRYLIPIMKPKLERCLYLDCDIIVEDSLNLLYHSDFLGNYVCATEDMAKETKHLANRNLFIQKYFNAGILLINNEQWSRDKTIEKLFFNTEILILQDKLKYMDQDVLNYTFKDRWLTLSPRYNVQDPIYDYERLELSAFNDDLVLARYHPIIIHFTGPKKPWKNGYTHILGDRYFHYLKYTPFYEEWHLENKNIKPSFYQNYIHNLQLNAGLRIKNQLSYKMGNAIIKAKNPFKAIILPFTLITLIKQHRLEQKVYKILCEYKPELKLPPIESYADYEEALKAKEHLSYRIGNALIKHPLTFMFYIKKAR